MKPSLWQPPVELSVQEAHIMKRIRKAKLFVFLRQHRHEVLEHRSRIHVERASPQNQVRKMNAVQGRSWLSELAANR
jgi:hypothetical protein